MSGSLDDLAVFAAVARVGTVSGAARKLRMPKSSVSRALARLEEALGVQLVQRTTRRSRLTLAGEALLAKAEPLVAALSEALLPARAADTPTGLLRVTCTIDFGASVVAELVARFVARYPAVEVEVHAANAIVDLVSGGFDLGIRFSTSRSLRDSTLVARRVGALQTHLVAAPSYLARCGTPHSPRELRGHDWVYYAGANSFVIQAGGRSQRVVVRGRVRCDDMFFARAAAVAGAGIAVLPSFLAAPELQAGTLVALLPKWQSVSVSVWVVHPPSRNLPAKVTVFREWIAEALANS